MHIHDYSKDHSILNQFIYELRDHDIQKDAMRFRKNIERVGEILAYEMSKSLEFDTKKVQTPLGEKEMSLPQQDIVLCSILRAGLPLHQGLLNYFDGAENAFISAYRNHPNDDDEFEVIVKYLAAPSLEGKTLILTDPMLATGKTLKNVLDALKPHGTPAQIHIISVIGSQEGVDYVQKEFPESTHLWISAIDHKLSSKGYIIPGLGDAGDLSYGVKL
ncbi:uracil phosphoribosyltransferase [Dokdonia sp. Hel_I_63]|jgi:uracil phosphoribosyltransferase|uniref:uracil phosphoribosyltransferase n=1 Tax=unclassified Dokdonia TaxID=2615033 RepID=UPI00020A7348|nr:MULTISPECIES: uracil phosphoribosyltransferase [unclassified Dokdonia]AEE20316.1 phosphoribosyltransferase [Dokdonia sp. 4H-3-7-5]TVZ23421.1 uracil phosphoribosyltransferase [Dokdonia sp. Hel_I_63]|tara:strand:- start:22316 stop:22969 length:654 start_codon:yes stop_codon:yes gene_type:complete